ncbi:hypothetical protein [Nonomuraea zeae]|uniref:Uncharacterized protein n=1 Tax=Nonomuraea zeae TaxID=1642303 RepID=A0A5S4GA57_9ACTN|nr:hypothetical protein [Nonomuraea zeae]TMR29898.1 hypothetical protein ETD85_30740 [Nonomuraea zeae]
MSEYQYYEFLAIDRPLDEDEQAEVRALSTRAVITSTSFINEYEWGDFRGDPARLMERYYDAHLYLANWGTHRLMLRLPRALLPLKTAQQYCVSDQVTAWVSGEHLILDLSSEDEEGDWEEDAERSLAAMVGVRAELAAGDVRPLYLAWLAAYGAWERDEDAFDYADEDELEAPVPPGLGSLTAPQRALAGFLRLDADLLSVAATASPPLTGDDPQNLAAWIAGFPAAEKDALLLRVAQDHAAAVRAELLRRFRASAAPQEGPRRTVAALLDAAAVRRAERDRQAAARHAEEQTRRERERALARERRLSDLAEDEEAAWARAEALIATKRPGEYDEAVELLKDLETLAHAADRTAAFSERFTDLQARHSRKPSLIERFNRAGLKPA